MLRKAVGVLVIVLAVGFVSVLYPIAWATILPVDSQTADILLVSMDVLAAFFRPILLDPAWWIAGALAGFAVAQSRNENGAA